MSTLPLQSMKPGSDRNQERIDPSKFRTDAMYGLMEHEFGEQPYANGRVFSMSDCAEMPALFYVQRAAPFDEHKNIRAYWDRLASRPSVRRVISEADPHVRAFLKDDEAA